MTGDPDPRGPASRGALVRSSALVGIGTALSRATGLLRVFALLYALDQTRLADVYTLANTMPNLVYELLLGGVLSATLVPVFTERVHDDDGGTSAVVSTAALVLVVVTVVGIVAAPVAMGIFAAGLTDPVAGEVEAFREVGTTLLRYLMPQVLFYGLITVVTALLHARRSFAAPAYAPILNNLAVCVLFVTLPTIIGRDLTTGGQWSLLDAVSDPRLLALMGLGTTAGVALMAGAMVPSLLRSGVRLRFDPNWRHPAVRTVLRLSGWTVGYVVANQVALYVVLYLANGQDPGDVTAYNVAFTFFQLPHGLFAVSIMTTFLPEMAAAAQSDDTVAFRARFVLGVRLMALVILPASAGYVALSRPVVELLPLHDDGVGVTSGVLAMFAAGLFGFSVYLFVLRGFYARKDTRTPFLLNLAENGVNIVLAFPFVAWWGVRGLAGAYSVAYLVAAVVALRALARRVGGLGLRSASRPVAAMAVAAASCGGAAWLAASVVSAFGPAAEVAAGVVVGASAYAVVLVALRVEEVATAWQLLRSLPRRLGSAGSSRV